jgi:hypothetical protein
LAFRNVQTQSAGNGHAQSWREARQKRKKGHVNHRVAQAATANKTQADQNRNDSRDKEGRNRMIA